MQRPGGSVLTLGARGAVGFRHEPDRSHHRRQLGHRTGCRIRVAERGTSVVLTYNANRDGAQETVATIERQGGTAVALPLDVGRSETFPAFAERLADEMGDRWGRTTFDFLVNNAGFGQMAMFEDTTEELFDAFHRVLLKGPFFLTQRLVPMLADDGAIVNVTSNAALTTGMEAGFSAYGSMKGGLTVLTRYLAKELSPRGIRVNAVSPGPTRTRLSGDAFERFPEVIPPLVERTALGPHRGGRRHRQGHRRTAVRRLRLDHRREHRGVGRLQPLTTEGCLGFRHRCLIS